MQVSVVNLVTDEIIFNVALQISVVSVADDEIIFNLVLQISVVSIVNDEIISHLVLKSRYSVSSVIKLFFMLSCRCQHSQ